MKFDDQVESQLVDTTLGTQEGLLRQLIRQRKRLLNSVALTRRRDTAALHAIRTRAQ